MRHPRKLKRGSMPAMAIYAEARRRERGDLKVLIEDQKALVREYGDACWDCNGTISHSPALLRPGEQPHALTLACKVVSKVMPWLGGCLERGEIALICLPCYAKRNERLKRGARRA